MRKNLAVLAVLIFLTSCANGEEFSNEDIGTVAGVIVGVAVGSLLGSESGQAAAMIVGGALGGVVGNIIGERLDEAEQMKAALAAQNALDGPTGESVSWTSPDDSHIRGSATPVSDPVVVSEAVCRDVKEIVIIGGQEETATNTYCWNGETWAAS